MSKKKIPTIIGIFILIVGLAIGVFLIKQRQIFKLGASQEATPKDVRITNITDSSFSVSWLTDKKVNGYLKWGEKESLGKIAQESSSSPENIHYVTLRNLSSNTTYFFKINSAGQDFDNNGIAWQIKTGSSLSPPSTSQLISGKVLLTNDQPAANVLVYVISGGMSALSTLTSENGEWVIPLSSARNTPLTNYANLENIILEIFVNAGPLGIASAQAYPENANPVPNMTLGHTYDFRNNQLTQTDDAPIASPELPSESSQSSKFTSPTDNEVSTEKSEDVTLESIDQDETIYTQTPEFFGEALPGTKITITVESNLISQEITVPSTGTWVWTPPAILEEGFHTITISWTDTRGILRTLTRNFTVIASDQEPAFESTPSATPTPSPERTPTPTASPTASPSPTPSLSPSPRGSIPSTESGLPTPGISTPTLTFTFAGLILLITGAFLIYLQEENQ